MYRMRKLNLCIFYAYTNCAISADEWINVDNKRLPKCKNICDLIRMKPHYREVYKFKTDTNQFDCELNIFDDITKRNRKSNTEARKHEEERLRLFEQLKVIPNCYKEGLNLFQQLNEKSVLVNRVDGLINDFIRIGLGSEVETGYKEIDGQIVECFKAYADFQVVVRLISELLYDKFWPQVKRPGKIENFLEPDTFKINEIINEIISVKKQSHSLPEISTLSTHDHQQKQKNQILIRQDTSKVFIAYYNKSFFEVIDRCKKLDVIAKNVYFYYKHVSVKTLLLPMTCIGSYKPTNSMEVGEIFSVYKKRFWCLINGIKQLDETFDTLYTDYKKIKKEIAAIDYKNGMCHTTSDLRFCKFIDGQKFKPIDLYDISFTYDCQSIFSSENILFKNHCECLFLERFLILQIYDVINEISTRRSKYYNYVVELKETIDNLLKSNTVPTNKNLGDPSLENKNNTEFLCDYSTIKGKLICLSQEEQNIKVTNVLNFLKTEMQSINTKILWNVAKLSTDLQMNSPTYFDENILYHDYFIDMLSRVCSHNKAIEKQDMAPKNNTQLTNDLLDLNTQIVLITKKYGKQNVTYLPLSAFVDKFSSLKDAFMSSFFAFHCRSSTLDQQKTRKTFTPEHFQLYNLFENYEEAVIIRKRFIDTADEVISLYDVTTYSIKLEILTIVAWLYIKCTELNYRIDQTIPATITNIENDFFTNDIFEKKYEELISKLDTIVDEFDEKCRCENPCIQPYERSKKQKTDVFTFTHRYHQRDVVKNINYFAEQIQCSELIEKSESALNKRK